MSNELGYNGLKDLADALNKHEIYLIRKLILLSTGMIGTAIGIVLVLRSIVS